MPLITVNDLPEGRFFKVTNKEEVHYGMKYKTGLNVDVIPFSPWGVCRPGGLYFVHYDGLENVPLNGTPHAYWIREVKFPPDVNIYQEKGKYKADKIILEERELLSDFFMRYTGVVSDSMLEWSMWWNDLGLFEHLISLSDLNTKRNSLYHIRKLTYLAALLRYYKPSETEFTQRVVLGEYDFALLMAKANTSISGRVAFTDLITMHKPISINSLRWLIDNGFQPTEEHMLRAARFGTDAVIIELLRYNGFAGSTLDKTLVTYCKRGNKYYTPPLQELILNPNVIKLLLDYSYSRGANY